MDCARDFYSRGMGKRIDPDRKTDDVCSALGGDRAYAAALQLATFTMPCNYKHVAAMRLRRESF